MSSPAYSKKKEPEKVRQALIDAAASLVVERGLSNVTVSAVSAGAGVTKGALFHHFADRDALVAAMIDSLLRQLDQQLNDLMSADLEPYGRFTRAYLNAALAADDANRQIWVALIATFIGSADHARIWYEWVDERVARHLGESDDNLVVVRLAADGAWFAIITGWTSFDLNGLRNRLTAMTRQAEAK